MQTKAQSTAIEGECILWDGPLFGRLTKSGKTYLLGRGWRQTNDETNSQKRLAFIWPSKSGPQFELDDVIAAHIRPYPKYITDVFDDKIQMSRALEGWQSIAPKCVSSPEEVDSDRLYFVKHRYGAQGKSVYVYNKEELKVWWSNNNNTKNFVIQEEILPSLYEGRKFVLRSHILMLQTDRGLLKYFLHKRAIICQEHCTPYEKHSREKSSQVSQSKRKSQPLPILLEDLDLHHPAARSFPKIASCTKQLLSAVFNTSIGSIFKAGSNNTIGRDTTCFALMGADLIVDENGDIKICEVNSHPALGWGTMSKVPSKVFSNLIENTLSLLLSNGNIDEKEKIDFEPLFEDERETIGN